MSFSRSAVLQYCTHCELQLLSEILQEENSNG